MPQRKQSDGARLWPFMIAMAMSICCGGAPNTVPPTATKNSREVHQKLIDVRLPGSRVRFKIPPGYVRPSRMPLLIREDGGVRIIVQDTSLFESNDAVLRGMKDALLERSGGTAKFESIERSGARGVVVRGRMNDQELRAIALTAPRAFVSVLVLSKSDAGAAERIVDSVEIDRGAVIDGLEIMGLELDLADRFEAHSVAPMTMLLPKGVRPPVRAGTPHLAVAAFPHPNGVALDDQQLAELVGPAIRRYAPDMSKATTEVVEVDSLRAEEVVIPGTDDGTPVSVYVLVMADETDTLMLFGTVAAGAEKDLGELRRLARSLHRKPGTVGRIE